MAAITYFEKQRNELLSRLNEADTIIQLNQQLHRFNWMFVHPNLFGGDLSRLQERAAKVETTTEQITAVFADAFYDFRTTAYLVDGYVFTCPSILPFARMIDETIIMAVQHDYAGAINVLVPVVEGSIRHYLIHQKGKENSKIMKTEHLLQVFGFLKEDYCRHRHLTHAQHRELDRSQLKRLDELERQYFEKWINVITDYFSHCLYLNSHGEQLADPLNRHSILHGFSADLYFDLSNFLKVFHTLYFLAWAFRMADPSIPQHIDLKDSEIGYKWKALQQLRAVSEITLDLKINIYQKHPGFDERQFRAEPLDRRAIDITRFKVDGLEDKLQQINQYITLLLRPD